ncbi:hypothetical protein CH365_07595 [Leptospira neocaledonica]|uniref:Uncharacterized protein n=1 Tax=Leptospira neocaledonica TaxID=2023192 RepID=A0A2M9ZZG0_9LEPT|nr:hypothetical protein CH365_07595 [Leptospira neocaledonica]
MGKGVGERFLFSVFLIFLRGRAALDWRKGGPRFGLRVLNIPNSSQGRVGVKDCPEESISGYFKEVCMCITFLFFKETKR